MKNIGDAIAPITTANDNNIKKKGKQQQQEPISLARTQGETIAPKALAIAAARTPRITSPAIKIGTNKISAIKAKKAVIFGTFSA